MTGYYGSPGYGYGNSGYYTPYAAPQQNCVTPSGYGYGSGYGNQYDIYGNINSLSLNSPLLNAVNGDSMTSLGSSLSGGLALNGFWSQGAYNASAFGGWMNNMWNG